MKPLSSDTPLEVERVWLAALRERGPLASLRRCAELTTLCWRGAQQAARRAHLEATQEELDLLVLTIRYGEELARGVVRRRRETGFYG